MASEPKSDSKPRPFRFLLIFTCCAFVAFGILFTPPVQTLDIRFSRALVWLAHGLVASCGGHALREGAVLRTPEGFGVEMRDGCNAINVTILLWSAVVAFPASWKMKAIGLAAGSLIIQVLNIVRFISLFYLGQYSMTWFDFAHAYLWESLLMLDTMVIFWLWVKHAARSGTPSHARA